MAKRKNLQKRPLFIFEMANNHQGNLKHGLRIVREFYQVSKKFPFNFAFKLQTRHIPSFIHPDYKKRMDIKYVKRFSETSLSEDGYRTLKREIDKLGLIAVCTPFDEKSVDLVEKLDFDIIKIGSCSFGDWPLLERIVQTSKPIIASVAGVPLETIDKVVSFFDHRAKNFVLMHCVGEYPATEKSLQLNQIDLLKKRYPQVEIGFSTHEDPNNFDSIKMAIAKGATVFEKHVGLKTETIDLNAYSVVPNQAKQWLMAAKRALRMSGGVGKRMKFNSKELADLRQFKRGVFARQDLPKGAKLDMTNTFFAWPNIDDQLVANDMSKYMIYELKKALKKNQPVLFKNVKQTNIREKVYQIVVKTRQLLEKAKIYLPNQLDLEISHHYGLDKFYQTGAVIVNCVNREYCKKIIVLFPGQTHPSHFHKKKEETFQVLYGDMDLDLDGKKKTYHVGGIVLVKPGAKHSFSTKKGLIFEEVSTTHFKDDSFYEDKKITTNKERKTRLTYWLDI